MFIVKELSNLHKSCQKQTWEGHNRIWYIKGVVIIESDNYSNTNKHVLSG